jgi:hypothetical protein
LPHQDATIAKRSKPMRLGALLSLSVGLFVLSLVAPLPVGVRLLILLILAVAWGWIGTRWLVQRFGRTAAIAVAAVVLFATRLFGRAYWLDAPNRRLVAQIERLPGCHAANGGGLFAGKVDHVYISATAADQDVAQFAELDGLDDLHILLIDGPRITDATARRLSRLQSLRHLCLAGTGVSEAVVAELRRALPSCTIEIRRH